MTARTITITNDEPEFIQGLGQWRAGKGAIVTDWCDSKESARLAYIAMCPRSHASVRSYYFRKAIAEREMDQLAYGGIQIENYDLDDFRSIWRNANVEALIWRRRATNRYNHSTQAWEQGA